MPEGVTYEPHTNSCRKMHSWETEPILQPGESPSTLEQFPTNNKVYHFHPNMFVRQMKRMGSCFCDRDLTEEEVKGIVKTMRDSEKMTSYAIFTSSNCPLNSNDKDYKRLTEELNKTMKKYNINTCTRKAHFIAQCYWESDRLKTTLEYSSGNYLNPGQHSSAEANGNTVEGDGPRYKGRGLMQLTWRNNQKSYFEYLLGENESIKGKTDINKLINRSNIYNEKHISNGIKTIYNVDYAGLIANELHYSIDSAGWFWDVHRKYKDKNLNYYADFGEKYANRISRLVNGGGNGLNERKVYLEKLYKGVFNLKKCISYDENNQ